MLPPGVGNMPNPAGPAPAPQGYRSPAAPPKITAWPDADVSVVAFRFHALGGTERQTRLILDHLANSGVRRVRAYLDGIDDAELTSYLDKAEEALQVSERAASGARARGGLLTVRTPARWPWRTSSGQAIGGSRDGAA